MVAFEPAHLHQIELQSAQYIERTFIQPGYGEALASAGVAVTGMADGEPMVCAGVAKMWEGRGTAWLMMSAKAGPHMLTITRKVKQFLDTLEFRRVEMDVVSTFAAGHRWATMLGFTHEGRREKYYPDGGACDAYVRIR